ncbi:MAG: DNA-directed RNA polymerase subunit omega [Ignavibacteria bacterium]|nr:DNA-directed RNA polymerase subunit omega [Ignavibacteria bacterium]MBT8383221.1 DNA-directed RNA polymerase subunit omega [Ignavibacteria bacterium]MBT8392178.1 DNA-directed RNA polymerase subunit omega [Ignavibacteria bacterium]NNJ53838.1 DNA-directed RNA polymerase subunit omega [Ignavibacteriaceae bacterium]NNL20511.1 DNA-directed RNA polymerase subunit omega [Ignavibacteriaceae bacterium]
MSINPVDLREIEERAGNVYEAIIVCSKRARQLNSENKIEFNALLSTLPESTTDDESEDVDNPAQLKIALDLEKREKPHIHALNEFLESNLGYQFKE